MSALERAGTPVVISSTNPHELRALVAREVRRGAMVAHTPVTQVEPRRWAVGVTRTGAGRRRVRLAPVAGAAIGTGALAGLATLGWFLPYPAPGTVLGVLAVVCLLLLLRGRPVARCCQVIVTVIHRHR